jgi:hypothetical protein
MPVHLSHSQPVYSPSSSSSSLQTIPAPDIAYLVVINLVVISAIVVSIYACIPKRRHHSLLFKVSHQTRCHSCKYFSTNSYLKCALHPTSVLTEQAIDCSDYDSESLTEPPR